MLWFVIGLFLILAGLVALIFFKGPAKLLAGIPFTLAAMLIIVSMISIVGPRNVGVEHQFNRTTGTNHQAGIVWKAPWISVEDIDTRIQPEEYKGEDCIYVKIADGGRSCVSLAWRWRINKDNADDAFKDYGKKDDDIVAEVRKAVVTTNLKAALNEELGLFDPLDGTDITPDMTAQQISNIKLVVVPDYTVLNEGILENFRNKVEDLGGLVDIESVTVSYMTTPSSTQDRIDRVKNKILETKESLIDIANKEAQAKGNIALAESLQDPNVIVSKCVDGLISGDITNEPGFSCWGPGGSVVIPSAK
jgi:regulator of protease activity HflC (stomatin/prohibitin superfamily)